MEQLSFDVTRLFEPDNYVNREYKTELLRKQDDDYKILLRSTSNNNIKGF